MPKYEHKVTTLTLVQNKDESILNDLGKEGWELVGVNGFNGITAYLKRETQIQNNVKPSPQVNKR